jgi:hypothetical protein
VKILLVHGATINDETIGSSHVNKVVDILQKWPTTMWMLILQDLVVYHLLDTESFIDLLEYYGPSRKGGMKKRHTIRKTRKSRKSRKRKTNKNRRK